MPKDTKFFELSPLVPQIYPFDFSSQHSNMNYNTKENYGTFKSFYYFLSLYECTAPHQRQESAALSLEHVDIVVQKPYEMRSTSSLIQFTDPDQFYSSAGGARERTVFGQINS